MQQEKTTLTASGAYEEMQHCTYVPWMSSLAGMGMTAGADAAALLMVNTDGAERCANDIMDACRVSETGAGARECA